MVRIKAKEAQLRLHQSKFKSFKSQEDKARPFKCMRESYTTRHTSKTSTLPEMHKNHQQSLI